MYDHIIAGIDERIETLTEELNRFQTARTALLNGNAEVAERVNSTKQDIDELCNMAGDITGSYQPDDMKRSREFIEQMRMKLYTMFKISAKVVNIAEHKRGPRHQSASAKRKISEAQKRRWAIWNKNQEHPKHRRIG